MKRKEKASGAIGYMLLFMCLMILVLTSIYMLKEAEYMSAQRQIDDALGDSVLAGMVCDDSYFFETHLTGDGVLKFKNVGESFSIIKRSFEMELNGSLIKNLSIDEIIFYEKENDTITVTDYGGDGTWISQRVVTGDVFTPGGAKVSSTSVYAMVSFDLSTIATDRSIRKSRDIYCKVEVNGD